MRMRYPSGLHWTAILVVMILAVPLGTMAEPPKNMGGWEAGSP